MKMARATRKPTTSNRKRAKAESPRRKGTGKKPRNLDPITLAVLNKRFEAVTTKMANTLFRTGRSGVLNVA
jgi:hypothetical protein